MGLSKVYRGYVIEDVNGQWYIRNAPNFLNGFPFSPGPHGGWTVATRQVDKLVEYLNRGNSSNSARWTPRQDEQPRIEFRSSPAPEGDPTFLQYCIGYGTVIFLIWGVLSGTFKEMLNG